MKVSRLFGRHKTALVAVLTCVLVMPPAALAKSPVKMTKLDGMVDLAAGTPSPFVLEGIASHLGQYQAYGEVELEEAEDGSLVGTGPVVFQASNGDLLVGVATWMIDPSAGDASEAHVHFAWADSVTFSNGTVVSNTGRFTDNRPPGLVVVVSATTLVDLLILIIFRR